MKPARRFLVASPFARPHLPVALLRRTRRDLNVRPFAVGDPHATLPWRLPLSP
jgi:hypothetical protein